MAVRQDIREQLPDGVTIFDSPSYDNSIVGITANNNIVYSFEKMVEELAEENNMSQEEAIEYIEYNTVRMLPYLERPPVIMYKALWQ